VDANAPGADNGTNWESAYNFLQDALADANSSEKPIEIRVAQGAYTPDEKYQWKETLQYPYGRNVAKLYTALTNRKVKDYIDVVNTLDGTELFKLNLYPIAFRNTDQQLWKANQLDKRTGFEEKHLFQVWCFLNRFPALAKLTGEYRPKLIIGTGISYLTDFFACFAGTVGVTGPLHYEPIRPRPDTNNSVQRSLYWAKLQCGTILAVIPFFSGAYGLNSNALLQQTGDRLRELII